jgi:hypothetical protein
MDRYRFGRRADYGGRRRRWRRWPRSRAAGCLLWIVLLVVLLIVLSVMFGGFQKGAQVKGLGPARVWASVRGPVRGPGPTSPSPVVARAPLPGLSRPGPGRPGQAPALMP